MTYAVISEAILILALVALVYGLERANKDERADRAAAYERTLQTMADRIQAPDRVPLSSLPTFDTPDPEPDEVSLVGTIEYDENYGTED